MDNDKMGSFFLRQSVAGS